MPTAGFVFLGLGGVAVTLGGWRVLAAFTAVSAPSLPWRASSADWDASTGSRILAAISGGTALLLGVAFLFVAYVSFTQGV